MTPPRAPTGLGLATSDAPPLDLPFRFFGTVLAAFAVLALLSPWDTVWALGRYDDPRLIAFVHINVLGVIAATILGASYQLLPVVLQVPLASFRFGRLTWWLFVPGVVALALGLSQEWTLLLSVGGTLLAAAIWIFVGITARTLVRSSHRDVVVWHIVVGVAGLAVGTAVGLLLALSQPGGPLGSLGFRTVAAHVTLMLGGWVTPMLMGVAYRLVGMFTLNEDRLHVPMAWTELALTAGGTWLLVTALLFGLGRGTASVGAFALCIGMGLFAAQLVRLYRTRRRRTFDIHLPFLVTATVYGLLASGLVLWGVATSRPAVDAVWRAAGWLAIAGWAESAIQGFLYKIGAFLVWLHRYAPLAGRQRVPRLGDLYGLRMAIVGWAAWSTGVAAETIAILSGVTLLAHLAAAALSLGLVALLVNVARMAMPARAADGTPPAPHATSRGRHRAVTITPGTTERASLKDHAQ